jgi:hypothetical protein
MPINIIFVYSICHLPRCCSRASLRVSAIAPHVASRALIRMLMVRLIMRSTTTALSAVALWRHRLFLMILRLCLGRLTTIPHTILTICRCALAIFARTHAIYMMAFSLTIALMSVGSWRRRRRWHRLRTVTLHRRSQHILRHAPWRCRRHQNPLRRA